MRRLVAGGFAAAILGGLAIGASGSAGAARALTGNGSLCPLLALTGLPCPFCGMTRATVALGAGDLDRALALHPLAPLVLLASFVVAAAIALGRDRWLRARHAPAIVAAVLAVVWTAKLAA